jgi:hypothetical protein
VTLVDHSAAVAEVAKPAATSAVVAMSAFFIVSLTIFEKGCSPFDE